MAGSPYQQPYQPRETSMTEQWLTIAEAAAELVVSHATVYRSLKDPVRRAAQWGAEGEGWRYMPLASRPTYQVSRRRLDEIKAPTGQ
jgi:hypothetical protein